MVFLRYLRYLRTSNLWWLMMFHSSDGDHLKRKWSFFTHLNSWAIILGMISLNQTMISRARETRLRSFFEIPSFQSFFDLPKNNTTLRAAPTGGPAGKVQIAAMRADGGTQNDEERTFCLRSESLQGWWKTWVPSGDLSVYSYWKLPFRVNFPMKHGDFPYLC